ncbi:TetR family transcriptional regulator C-terminal domain-containing protein [Agrobacterium salinitolerans]|uniref:TetR family transcriptional regulator C-terminal domain-containing protein n=1 Tax=Agrobacterium salinitolerans TaxID=1183413 RepID=A0A9X9KCF5_9HYPH|nr:TetR family transcriptional regulator C-terminal domain-containing protein [Agrobacterium salinitolerans]UYZ08986.1 TetR family transcriptional regulator C-terminal domain-containing protein [Agrobacterium salinitolerans]
MPRTVDHEERRSMILGAFIRVAAREGLHAVSLRGVAAEAGISLRSVQYYFETKATLMQSGLTALETISNERLGARLRSLGPSPGARVTLEAYFAVALPTDHESRQFHLLWTSYAMLAMTDPEISDRTFVDGPNYQQRRIASLLEKGKSDGDFHGALDSEVEATILICLMHGLGTAVLVGQQTAERAFASFGHYLDRLTKQASGEPDRPQQRSG